jgi:probable rRNA maturation factor
MKHTIVILDRTGRIDRPNFLKAALEAILDAEDQPPSSVEVLITDEQEIRSLNNQFRGIDASTDVLSFPAGAGPEVDHTLGEIAICLAIAQRQAAARGVTIESELACLAVHGCLHLLGYDDGTDADRDEMIAKMNAAVSSCGHDLADEWGSIYTRS